MPGQKCQIGAATTVTRQTEMVDRNGGSARVHQKLGISHWLEFAWSSGRIADQGAWVLWVIRRGWGGAGQPIQAWRPDVAGYCVNACPLLPGPGGVARWAVKVRAAGCRGR